MARQMQDYSLRSFLSRGRERHADNVLTDVLTFRLVEGPTFGLALLEFIKLEEMK